MKVLLKIASHDIEVTFLRNMKKAIFDEKRNVIVPRGADAILAIDKSEGKAIILPAADFHKIPNESAISRIFRQSGKRTTQFISASKVQVGQTEMEVGFLPVSLAAGLTGAATGVVEGSFQELKGRFGMTKKSSLHYYVG